jgi:hypothetical protein
VALGGESAACNAGEACGLEGHLPTAALRHLGCGAPCRSSLWTADPEGDRRAATGDFGVDRALKTSESPPLPDSARGRYCATAGGGVKHERKRSAHLYVGFANVVLEPAPGGAHNPELAAGDLPLRSNGAVALEGPIIGRRSRVPRR